MERSEPTLVPEWLRSTGNNSGGGTSAHHFASSSSHSDVPSQVHYARSRTSKNSGDFDTPRAAFLDRSSSSNSRKGSSNGSAKHAYSSFNRGHRDKDRDKEKERLSFGDHWDRDGSDVLGNIFSSRVDKDLLRRSNSMVSRKHGEIFPRRGTADAKISANSNHNNDNGLLPTSNAGITIQKAVFDKAFPLLGSEEKQGVQEIGRVSSPGLSTAAQSLPFSNSALIAEGWTSALAEVPSMIGGGSTISSTSNSAGAGTSSVVQLTCAANSGLGSSSATVGLNMAEALAQAPLRARTAPQVTEVSVKTQRLEELAIKQSRQLIPVIPSMPKPSILTSDKLKPKAQPRTNELNVIAKSGQQGSSVVQQANHSFRSGNVKTEVPKASHGKFLVLKPVRENGVLPTQKDASSPTSNANSAAANSQVAVASVLPASSRSSNNQNSSSLERKMGLLEPKSGSILEKRSSVSQVQSRNAFFNLIKMKTSMGVSSNSGTAVPTSTGETSDEVSRVVIGAPASPCTENGAEITCNGGNSDDGKRYSNNEQKIVIPSEAVYPDEEEAAFLRSLGWEENYGEDEGLTEEEINAFYQEYMKLKPSLKACRGVLLKLSMSSECHGASVGEACSELSSSGSESEA